MRFLAQLVSFFYVIKYRIYHLFNKKTGLNKQARNVKLLVSLTTYPPRLNTVYLAIESLLNQTFKPDKIILWLAKEEIHPNDMPSSLLKLKQRGLEIKWVDGNIKSYKKLIYAVEEFSDYHIVTCDDDLMYHKWFLQGLYQSYEKHPDCISAYRAWAMVKTCNHQLAAYNKWQFSNNQTPSYNTFATGGGGVWYPPYSLSQQISNRLFMQLAPSGDDIWFKAMGLLNQTKTVMVRPNSIDFPTIYIQASQTETLWQKNIHENDRQLKAVFDYFNLYHLLKSGF